MSLSVCITGATAGIGLAAARQFHALGARLVLLARREDRLMNLQRELSAQVYTVDVTDEQAVKNALKDVDVDILVNNAGMAAGLELAQNADLSSWKQMVDVNINGLLYVTHALLPRMGRYATSLPEPTAEQLLS